MCGITSYRADPEEAAECNGRAANTLVKALGDVLREIDLQTQRRDALITLHHEAWVAADTWPKVLDTETEQMRQSAQVLAQQKQQALAAAQLGFLWGDQDGSRMGQTTQNQNEEEILRIRMEMERMRSEMITHATQPNAGPNQPWLPENTVRGTRSPVPTNPTTAQTVHRTPTIFAQNWNANTTTGMSTPASGGLPACCSANKNRGYAAVGYTGGNVHPCQPGIVLPSGIVDSRPASAPVTYAQWKRELNLWISPQNGASSRQLLAEIIVVIPAPAEVDGPEYMESTEMTTRARDIASFLYLLDGRYIKTDSEK